MTCTACVVTNTVNSDEATKALTTGFTICSECSTPPTNNQLQHAQERTYEKCPTSMVMRFWEGQCTDINCHAGTLTKSIRRSLEAAIKEKRRAHAEEVKAAMNHHDESQRPLVQGRVFGECPKCK
jgi:hypothetical protein